MSDIGSLERQGEIGIITIDSPPVNALGWQVRVALTKAIESANADSAIKAIILRCAGRTFFAGADITEIGKPIQPPTLREALDVIEASKKPVVAAIHGTALGGGLETALVCHCRVAADTAKFGLPEVKLGILPGAGGTQRLTRIVGPEVALDLITSGRTIGAEDALAYGVIDAVAPAGDLVAAAIRFARQLLAEGRQPQRVRDREDKIAPARGKPEIFTEFRRRNARAFRGFMAPENIIKAVEAAVKLPFDAGSEMEYALFRELAEGRQSAAQRHIFFAERQAAKIPGLPADIALRPIDKVAVIGAGTMGSGIAMNFLDIGLPVTIVETSQAALDRGAGVIGSNYQAALKKGRISNEDFEKRMALLSLSVHYEALADADLVIEAVFESLEVKQQVFTKLDQVAKSSAILASNTSFLDLDKIAAATSRPEFVVGLHFFSPANVMRLLEVVRGAATSAEVVATAMGLARRIGKIGVLAGVCDGFIANRVMRERSRQAEAMVLEGTKFEDVDRAIYNYGFAVGPFQMMDIVGLDVLARDPSKKTVHGELVARDRLGQKKNGGFYDYDKDRNATPSNIAIEVIAEIAEQSAILQNPTLGEENIISRLLYPIVNEGARLLEEGIAIRASDIDIACIAGYNWPVYTGGPMFWADTVGLPKIVAGLKAFEAKLGPAFKVAALLERLAAEGRTFN